MITRKDIRELLGCNKGRLEFAIKWSTNFNMPIPVGIVTTFKSRNFGYDEEQIKEWIKTEPFKNIKYDRSTPQFHYKLQDFIENSPKPKPASNIPKNLEMMFLSGKFDSPEKRIEHMQKLDNAIKTKPKTKIVHLHDTHEQSEIRHIDPFYVLHDFNHNLVI